MTSFETFLGRNTVMLTEGSVYERLRRHAALTYDPYLAHGGLIYEPEAAAVLAQIHRDYLAVGRRYGLPMLALTDTWRASHERIDRSRFRGRAVNQDNARFVCALRDAYHTDDAPVFVAGVLACRGDAYRPDEALSKAAAAAFHAPQAQALAATAVDVLLAATLPACSEAQGLAVALAETGKPYMLSFVVRPQGTLLDGTPLAHAIAEIDGGTARPPAGYFVNCVHPTVLEAALTATPLGSDALRRLVGFQANTSARSPEALAGLDALETEDPAVFAASMVQTRHRFGIPILGGCCGTDTRHIEHLALALRPSPSPADTA